MHAMDATSGRSIAGIVHLITSDALGSGFFVQSAASLCMLTLAVVRGCVAYILQRNDVILKGRLFEVLVVEDVRGLVREDVDYCMRCCQYTTVLHRLVALSCWCIVVSVCVRT